MDDMNYLGIINRFVFIAITCFLQSCIDPATVTTTSAQVVYNRTNWLKILNDHSISSQAYRRIYTNNDRYNDTSVAITTFNRVVLMTGQIPTLAQRREIESIVKRIPGTKEVYNLTSLSKPVSALTQLGDSLITAKIKTKYLATTEVDPTQIKVITENGTVYLMGVVPHSQADMAIDLARTTEGVQNVVKVFSYIYIGRS